MAVHKIPLFADFYLLKRSMLEVLGDYSILSHNLLHRGYSNGILAGCELTTTEAEIILHKGAILLNEEVFFIKEPMTIMYRPTEKSMRLNIRFSDTSKDADFIYQDVDLVMVDKEENGARDMELCRFKLQEGARLRDKYQDFEDRYTEFDTIQTIHAPYAAIGGSTLSPKITSHFAEEMLKSNELSDLDTLFCIQLLQQERPIGKPALKAYIERRSDMELKDVSNQEIYKELARILREQKATGVKAKKNSKKKWTMMVD